MYHYLECGLSDVYLNNGVNVEETPWGEAVHIDNIEGLHKAIGLNIVSSPVEMSGEQFRFLRKELGLSQKKTSAIMGVTDQTVANWEKGNTEVPRPADLILRALYSECMCGNTHLKDIINSLNDQDRCEFEERMNFDKDDDGSWHAIAA